MESPPPPRPRRSKAAHWVLDAVGVLMFTIGAIDIFIPGMPTTVFWIIAVVCFLKTRPWAVKPLLKTPIIGPAIIGFLRWRPFGGGRKRPVPPPTQSD